MEGNGVIDVDMVSVGDEMPLMIDPFDKLPRGIAAKIVDFLDIPSQSNCALVSRAWSDVARGAPGRAELCLRRVLLVHGSRPFNNLSQLRSLFFADKTDLSARTPDSSEFRALTGLLSVRLPIQLVSQVLALLGRIVHSCADMESRRTHSTNDANANNAAELLVQLSRPVARAVLPILGAVCMLSTQDQRWNDALSQASWCVSNLAYAEPGREAILAFDGVSRLALILSTWCDRLDADSVFVIPEEIAKTAVWAIANVVAAPDGRRQWLDTSGCIELALRVVRHSERRHHFRHIAPQAWRILRELAGRGLVTSPEVQEDCDQLYRYGLYDILCSRTWYISKEVSSIAAACLFEIVRHMPLAFDSLLAPKHGPALPLVTLLQSPDRLGCKLHTLMTLCAALHLHTSFEDSTSTNTVLRALANAAGAPLGKLALLCAGVISHAHKQNRDHNVSVDYDIWVNAAWLLSRLLFFFGKNILDETELACVAEAEGFDSLDAVCVLDAPHFAHCTETRLHVLLTDILKRKRDADYTAQPPDRLPILWTIELRSWAILVMRPIYWKVDLPKVGHGICVLVDWISEFACEPAIVGPPFPERDDALATFVDLFGRLKLPMP